MMEGIAVTFTLEGRQYNGTLSKVTGGGSTGLYYLYVNERFRGQLFYSPFRREYLFASQKGYFPEIARQLEKYVESSNQNI